MIEVRQEDAHRRNRSIRLAVVTSLFSKLGTVILRLVSIPIAIRVLGMEEFGVYATITMAVALIDTFHVGIGPALTQAISRAAAAGDRDRERAVFVTAFLISSGLTLLIATVLACLLYFLPVETLFGEKFLPYAGPIHRACTIAIIVIAIQLISMVSDKARDGYLETRYNNAWGAGGNFLGAIVLASGIWFFPTIEFLVLAINGSAALGKLCNAIHLMRRRPYLIPVFSGFRRELVKPLVHDGALFTVGAFNALAEYNAASYLIGRLTGPAAAGVFAVLVTLHMSLTGVIQMLTIPAWPALVDAKERGDIAWIQKMAHRLQLIGPAFAVAVGIGLIALGPWALPLWAGKEFQLDRFGLLAFSVYFLVHIWRHVNHMLLYGLGKVAASAAVTAVEALVVLVTVAWACSQGADVTRILWTMVVSLALVGSAIYPVLVRRSVREIHEPGGVGIAPAGSVLV